MPEHTWLPWKFHHLPAHWFANEDKKREYISWFEKQVGFTRLEDWYGATVELFQQHGGISSLLDPFGTVKLTKLAVYSLRFEPP